MSVCAYGCGRAAPHAFGKGGTRFRCDPDPRNCPTEGPRLKEVAAASRARFHAKRAASAGDPQPCTTCGGPGRFYSTHYGTWRCEEIAGACPGLHAKREATLLDTYGTTKVAHIEGVQDKRSKTLTETHAKRGRAGREAIDRKRQATMQERYGVVNAGQRPEHWEGIKERFRAEHGVEHWLQTPEGMAKQKATVLDRYGADHVQRVPEIRAKTEATNIERYGGKAPLQNAEVFARWFESSVNARKQITLPSGKNRWVQGYEEVGIRWLLKQGFKEDDIKTERTEVPTILYEAADGERKVHFPDIYVHSHNHIVEIKSPFTRLRDPHIPAKRAAAVKAGYRYTVLICTKKKLVEVEGDAIVQER